MKPRKNIILKTVALLTLTFFLPGTVLGQTLSSWSRPSSSNQPKTANSLPGKTDLSKPFVIQKVSGLQSLEQECGQKKKAAALELVNALKPAISPFRDIGPEELSQWIQRDPSVLERAIVTPDNEAKLRTYADQVVRCEQGLAGKLNELRPPQNFPAVTKDFHDFAALSFQQALDRKLGALFHSTVQKLSAEYDLNIIANQDPYQAVKGAGDGECDASHHALKNIGTYLAGAGVEDLRMFELGLYYASELVVNQFDERGLQAVVPSVLLDMAPVFMLACDVGKYRGLQSPSCAWFSEKQALLKQASRELREAVPESGGWPCGVMSVWDRQRGGLDDFKAGRETLDAQCSVANPEVFLNSITPAAINYGECGFANMFYACPKNFGSEQIYPCLGDICNSLGGGTGDSAKMGTSTRASLAGAGTLSGMESSSVAVAGGGGGEVPSIRGMMDSFFTTQAKENMAQLCESQRTAPSDGGLPTAEDCFSPATDPNGKYAECLQEALGIESVTQGNLETYSGVPTGNDCDMRRDLAIGGDISPNTVQAMYKHLWEAGGKAVKDTLAKRALTGGALGGALGGAAGAVPAATAGSILGASVGSTGIAGAGAAGAYLGAGGGLAGIASAAAPSLMALTLRVAATALVGTGVGIVGAIAITLVIAAVESQVAAAAEPAPTGGSTSTSSSGGSSSNTGTSGSGTSGSSTSTGTSGTSSTDPAQQGAADATDAKATQDPGGIDPTPSKCTALGKEMAKHQECTAQLLEDVQERNRIEPEEGQIRRPTGPMEMPVPDRESPSHSAGEDYCFIAEGQSPPSGSFNDMCKFMECGPMGGAADGCCGVRQEVDLGAGCLVCDGVPAIGPDGQCLPECPQAPRETGPIPVRPGGPVDANQRSLFTQALQW